MHSKCIFCIREISAESEWDGAEAGGSVEYPTWRNNPQYFLAMESPATVQISLEQLTRVNSPALVSPVPLTDSQEPDEIGFYLMRSEGQRVILIKPDAMIAESGFKKEKAGKL